MKKYMWRCKLIRKYLIKRNIERLEHEIKLVENKIMYPKIIGSHVCQEAVAKDKRELGALLIALDRLYEKLKVE